jgi:hypothetical protein
MARIKKYSPEQNLSSFQTFVIDDNPNSDYFRITEFNDTFTGGKNGFLIEGSQYLKETTEIKIEILDVEGNPIYYEPAKGVPEYYEGISSLIAVYIYNDTPIGLGKITVLGELKQYDDNGVIRDVPDQWKGNYNVKWENDFQINKILANEDRVRFFKRPKVNIGEINKPIFNNNANLITQIGNVNGIPLAPTAGTSLSEFSLPTSYRLNVTNGSNWTGSIDGNRISFDDIDYNPIVLDVVSETEVIVSPPYAPNGIVAPFSNESYVSSFNYLEGVTDLATALTGSFAKISITDMKTVVGDAARVKVYRRSQSNLTDYEFVQEIQLESNELLRDIETTEANEISYGTFTQDVLSQYWITSSNDISVELNTGFLYNSAKLNSTEGNHFLTKQSFPIQSGVEYTLDFNLKKGSVSPTDFLKVTLSGSLNGTPKSQTIVNIPSSNAILQKRNFTENIIADDFDEAKLYFEVDGVDWYVNNVSLKASQETSFSPDEITFIQQVPKTLQTETFDYRFEFYDINNNYIPILVEDTKTFNGGNLNLFNKDITLTPNNLYFSFDSASAPANPLPPTTITFDVETTLVTGSITYTSGAYDEFGDILLSSQYAGGQYPGLMSGLETLSPTLTVSDYTGSRDDITVQYIRFTGEVEGVSDDVVITRTQDGKGGVNFEIRPYRGTIIKNNDESTLEVQAIRIDGVNEIILRDNLPQNGFSDAKLKVQSGSEYILLSDASSSGFIQGLTAGTTGSGELDYNAVFDRTSITGQLPLYLMDGTTEEDILTTLLLTDLQDGLGAGFTTFDVEQFNINPKEDTTFTPQTASLAGNFYLRGTNESPISGTLKVFPSMSIDESLLPEYYMFFETGAFDSRITVTATNAQNEIIGSGIPGDSVEYYTPIDSKQLTFNFTYVENFTSESISVDKTIFVVPDGLGIEPVVVSVDPLTLNLNSNQQGEVYSYTPLDTTITAKQGKLDLIYTGSEKPGTFYTESISTTNIEYTTESFTNTTLSLTGFDNMTSSLVASVDYNLKVYPYYTSSFQSQTITQRITKGVDGSDAVEIVIEPSVVSLQADENGTVTDYSTANTNIVVKQSNLYLSYETSSLPGTFNVSATGSGIVIGDISASSQYDLDFGDETVHFTNFSELEGGSGSVDYNFVVFPYSLTNGVAGVVETYNKKQVFSKSNDGTAARSVSLSTTTEVVNFDGDGVVTSPIGSIFLQATPFNVTGSQTYYQFFRDSFAYSLVGTDPTFEVGSGDATSPGETATWSVQIRDGNATSPVVASAEVTIAGIKAGADNYQVSLTNPSPSVGVEVDGTTTLDTTGTQIRAFKAATELTHVSTYSSETLDLIGEPIGTLGEFSASLHYVPTFITQPNIPTGNPANIDPITGWNIPQDNKSATLVYKVDIENGRATYFLSQSLSTVFEGATGPGIVMRGEWTGSIDYLFSLEQKRRDAVVYKYTNGPDLETHYFGTTNAISASKVLKLPYTPPDGYTDAPIYNGTQNQGDIDTFGWEYLGQQDMFVAAKIAIFEESFVENTINVGIPPDGFPNANIAIVGGTDEPYIAIGQQGTQGFAQPGIFMGMSNDGGPGGTYGTMGLLSLKSTPDGGEYKSMEWDGESLTIRGSIRQTSAGVVEPSLRGTWADGVDYNPSDLVQYIGETWSADTAHTSDISGNSTDGPPGTGPWTIAAGAGKNVSLLADSYVIQYDEFGLNPTPSSTIELIASSSNFIDAFFKFTGGTAGTFTSETSFSDGLTANTDTKAFSVPSAYFATPLTFKVAVSEGSQIEALSDTLTITALKSGADSTPMYFVTPIAGGTQIKNSSGNIQLQVQESSITGLSNISSGTIKLYKDDSSLLNASMSGITGDEYNPTIDKDAINGTLILELRDSSDDSVLDTITLLDVTDGLGGGSFISSNLKSTRNPSDNSFLPTSLTAQASFYDTSGAEKTSNVIITPSFVGGVDKMAVGAASGDTTNITITADDGDGGSITLGGASVATKDVVLTAVFTDPTTSQTNTITETYYIISDGADGIDAITIINPNQAHTVPANPDGTLSSGALTNSGTTIQVFEGTAPLSYVTTSPGDGQYNITPTQNPTSTMSTPSISGVGTSTATVADFTSMNSGTDSVSITYAISGKRNSGTVFTADTIQTLTKTPSGESGTNGTAGSGGTNGTAGSGGANGTPGLPGAGVVYRGEWDATKFYFQSTERKDIVKGSLGNYWIVNDIGSNGLNGAAWDDPDNDPGNWQAFGAQFSSVATDILFATDVYADQTINVGSSGSDAVIALNADAGNGNANPYISIGQSPQGFESDGIFIGFDEGTASLSLAGDNVKTNIGGWQVDKSGLFYETDYSIGDLISAELVATSSFSPAAIQQWLYYGSVYNQVYNIGFSSNGSLTPAETLKTFTRTADPFGSGSSLTAYGQITTTNTIDGGGEASGLTTFNLLNALYADSSSVDYQSYVTSSWDITGAGYGGGDVRWVVQDGTSVIFSDTAWNHVMSTTSGEYGTDILEYNFFGTPHWAPNSNAYILAEGVTIPADGGVAAYTSASLAIKLGTIEGDEADVNNNGIIGDFISSSAENTYGNIDLAAATKLTLYTIHRSGEDLSVSNVGTVLAGSLDNRIITGDAIRLSTSGSSTGTNKPFISIGQSSAGYDNRGAFLGFPSASEIPHFSLRSPSGDFLRYNGESVQFSGDFSGGTIEESNIVGGSISVPVSGEGAKFSVDVNGNVSASNASIGGIINADSGKIGNWIIDVDSGVLRDDDSEIVLDPGTPQKSAEIQLFDSGTKKVIIGPQNTLANTAGSAGFNMVFSTAGVATPDTNITQNSAGKFFNFSGFSIGDKTDTSVASTTVAVGDISITLDSVPALTLNPPTQTITQTTSYPNYLPSFNNQTHGNTSGPNFIRQIAYLFLEVVDGDNSDVVIGRTKIAQTSEARSAKDSVGNYYLGSYVDSGGGGGGLSSEITSVVGDTKITLSDGSYILAKDVKIGDKILSWNWNDKLDSHIGIDEFGEFTIDAIKTRTTTEIYKVTVGDKVIEVSDSHGFWLDNNEEIKTTELVEGESKIYVMDGDSISLQLVDKIELLDGADVYTFSVAGVYNYISNDILSHNTITSGWTFVGTTLNGIAAVPGTVGAQGTKSVSINVTTASANASLRYSVQLGTTSGWRVNTASDGTVSTSYSTATVAYNNTNANSTATTGYLQSFGSTLDLSVAFALPSNFVEIKAGGIQVVSGPDKFVKTTRRASGDTDTELFKVYGGTALFDNMTAGGGSPSDNVAISASGYIVPGLPDIYDIGTSNLPWNNIYANNGTINTSDENKKENIVTSDLGLDFINELTPISYRFISGSRTHYGLGAQSVETTLELVGKDSMDFAGLITGSNYALRYHEFISPMIRAIQELTDKVTQLEAQISGSNT